MKKCYLFCLLALAVVTLLASTPGFADDITLTLSPATGHVAGLAGSTVGWGYTITNNTSDWLQTEGVIGDPFQNGTATSLFGAPAVAPHSSVTVGSLVPTKSCPVPPCGLYELTWNSTAPMGFTDKGTFTVFSDFYSARPGTPGAKDLGPAPNASANYSATVNCPVPEPSSLFFVLSGVGALAFRFGRRSQRNLRMKE